MTPRTGHSARLIFLPPGVAKRLKSFVFESAGFALFAAAVLIAIALTGYHHTDPSFNTASSGVTMNFLGPAGAYTADLLLQLFGISAALLPLLLFAWGWRLIKKQGFSNIWVRLLISFAGFILFTLFLSAFNEPEAWPIHSGLGGATGTVIISFLSRMLSELSPGYETVIIATYFTGRDGFFKIVRIVKEILA